MKARALAPVAAILASLALTIAAAAADPTNGAGHATGAERARPDRVYVVMGSRHIGVDPADFGRARWNEVNPGLVASWERRALGMDYQLGLFVNSFGDAASYVSVARSWQVASAWRVSAVLSLADYGANSRYFPVILGGTNYVLIPGVQVSHRKVFAQWWPSPQKGHPWAGVLSVGLRLPVGK